MVDKRKDPYKSFNFLIEVGKLVVGGFTEVSGLRAEIEVLKFREGGLNEYMHQLPGPARFPNNLILKRGLTDADEMWSWYMDVGRGIIERKNGSIILKDDAGEEKSEKRMNTDDFKTIVHSIQSPLSPVSSRSFSFFVCGLVILESFKRM